MLGVAQLLAGHRPIAVIHLAVVAVQTALLLLLYRRPERAHVITHLGLGAALLGVFLGASLTGGAQSAAVWYLAGLPLLAGATLGRHFTLWWGLAALLALVAVEVMGRFVLPGPPAEGRLEWAAAAGIFVMASAATTLALRRLNVWELASLEQREDTIRVLLRGLAEKNQEASAARDAALSASRAKSEFLAVMSHEIRTPLNAVIGLTGVLLDTPLSGDQKDIAGTIRSSGSTLLTLLNDILDFSKIEAGRLDLENAPFDVIECAEDALELMGAAAADKRLDLSCHAAADLPARISGDAARVRQILVNLVSNAVKFTAEGAVEVHLGVERLGAEDIVVHGSVRDTGPGIPRARWSALFEPFSQLDVSTTSKFGGTGLGLAICRKLAERMGGRVWVESAKGVGSTFHFTFQALLLGPAPATPGLVRRSGLVITPYEGTRRALCAQLAALGVEAQAFAEAPPPAGADLLAADVVIADQSIARSAIEPSLAENQARAWVVLCPLHGSARDITLQTHGDQARVLHVPVRRSQLAAALRRSLENTADSRETPREAPLPEQPRLRVLLAEDNPVNQRVARLMLERLGHRVDVVADGAEAVAEVRRGEYDLVLMDMRMPEMDGPTATRRIRADLPSEKQPYIIALTANVAAADRDECVAAGMDAFLAKPIVLSDLRRTLATAVRALDPGGKGPESPARDAARAATLAGTDGAEHRCVAQPTERPAP